MESGNNIMKLNPYGRKQKQRVRLFGFIHVQETSNKRGLRVEWTGDGRMGEGKSKDKTKARVPASYFTSRISV